MKLRRKLFAAVSSLAVVLAVLLAGCGAPAQEGTALKETGVLTLSVNPEIQIEYNRDGKVTALTGRNDDGKGIVEAYPDYIGKDCETVLRDLIVEINEAGYFVDDIDGNKKNIVLQLEPGSVLPSDDFLADMSASTQEAVRGLELSSGIVTIDDDDYDPAYAKDGKPSPYITLEKAQERIARDSAGYAMAKRVARQFNLRREPTVDETTLAERWVNEMKLTEADVLAACAETVRARNPSFAYLDSILRRHAGGAGVQADIQNERKRVETLKEVYAELGAPGAPAAAELKTFTDFLNMGFQADTLVEAARRCARAGMRDFAAWEKYVNQCAQKGLFTLEALRENTRRIDELSAAAEKAMRAYGDDRRAGNADRAWIEKWLAAMPMDVILLAAERAQGTQLPRKYMGKLLANWQKKGIKTVEEAQKEEPVVRMDTAKPQAGKVIQDYAQREYHEEDFAVDAVMQMWMEDKQNDAQ